MSDIHPFPLEVGRPWAPGLPKVAGVVVLKQGMGVGWAALMQALDSGTTGAGIGPCCSEAAGLKGKRCSL